MKLPFQKKAGTITETPGSSHECKAFTTVTGTEPSLGNALTAMFDGTAKRARFVLLDHVVTMVNNGLLRSGS